MTPDTLVAVASPPPWTQLISSDDPDEVTSWVTRRDGQHSRVIHGTWLDAIAEPALAHGPGAAASGRMHGESRLLSGLAGALTWFANGRITPVSIQRLNCLEDWIDAHVGEAITLGRLCEVVQVGERSLQLAFQARRGMSPMRFVSERRLAAAQRRLSSAAADEDVTAIATSLGFTHLGRFSSAYRAAFGESPSRALVRGRRWGQTRSLAASAPVGGGQ